MTTTQSKLIILEAMQRDVREAYAMLLQIAIDRANAQVYWFVKQNYAGFTKDGETITYDEQEANKVLASYNQSLYGAELRLRQADSAVIEAFILLDIRSSVMSGEGQRILVQAIRRELNEAYHALRTAKEDQARGYSREQSDLRYAGFAKPDETIRYEAEVEMNNKRFHEKRIKEATQRVEHVEQAWTDILALLVGRGEA